MSTNEPSGDELSRTLRDLRAAAEMTSAAAANAAGIGQAALSRYETGRFVPTPECLDALLDAYDATTDARARLHQIVTDLRAENRRVVVHRRNAPAFRARCTSLRSCA